MENEKNTPLCRDCRHYYITYDPDKPHGCRAMKFKSRENPASVVFSASGLTCRLFQGKKR
ncbi:MAG: uracil-DNA glycosylase [Desulfobulbaceae bacterium]|nr:uracil-DNA glycosylase [Desulfobulbaceae bacterium]